MSLNIQNSHDRYFILYTFNYALNYLLEESSGVTSILTWSYLSTPFPSLFTKAICIPEHTMNANPISIEQHLKYKYLISLDGNTAAWQRVPWIMLSGSVLLLVETQVEEWFYQDIEAYVHYVPVKGDMSDVLG